MCTIFFNLFINIDGHLVCLYLLTIVNSATMSFGVQMSESLLSILLGIYLKSRIAGSCGNSMFKVLWNFYPFNIYRICSDFTSPLLILVIWVFFLFS